MCSGPGQGSVGGLEYRQGAAERYAVGQGAVRTGQDQLEILRRPANLSRTLPPRHPSMDLSLLHRRGSGSRGSLLPGLQVLGGDIRIFLECRRVSRLPGHGREQRVTNLFPHTPTYNEYCTVQACESGEHARTLIPATFCILGRGGETKCRVTERTKVMIAYFF